MGDTPYVAQKKSLFGHTSVSYLFWKIAPVQFLICSVGAINSMIDGLIASRYIGPEAMAAVSFLNPILSLLTGVVCVLSIGSVMLITTYIGKGDKVNASCVFTWATVLISLITLAFSGAMILFCENLATFLSGGIPNTLLANYIFGIAILLVFQSLSSLYINALQIICDANKAYLAVVVMGITNCFFDILFIRFLGMGAFGLGIATGMGYLAQFLFVLPIYLKKNCPLTMRFAKLPATSVRKVIKNGMPCILSDVSMSVNGFLMNFVLLAVSGTMAVAARTVQNTFCWMAGSLMTGVSQAVLFLTVLFISEEDRESLRQVFVIFAKAAAIIGTTFAALLILFAGPIAGWFYDCGSEAYDITVESLRIFPLFLPFNIAYYSILSMYQGQEKTRLTYVLSFLENIVIGVLALLLVNGFGTKGVWASLPAADILLILFILLYIRIVKKKFTLDPYDLMLLSDEVGTTKQDRLEKTMYTPADAIHVNEKVWDFCKAHNMANRIVYAASLCVEEICMLLFRYSLKDTKKPRVDVRVLYKNDKMLLRIRDNGAPLFNGEELVFDDPDDPSANIGIKMLQKLTDTATTSSVMGMNVITITLDVNGSY